MCGRVRRIQREALREDLEQAGVVVCGMLEHRGVRLQQDVNGGHATGLESQRQCCGFRVAIACRWNAFGAERREFGLGCLQIRAERGIGVQPRHGGRAHETAPNHVAIPMMVADDAALAKRPAAGEDLVGTIRRNLAQDEGKPPTEGGVPGRIGRILFQEVARFRNGEGFAILLEGPRAFVVVLRGVGGDADISERASTTKYTDTGRSLS